MSTIRDSEKLDTDSHSYSLHTSLRRSRQATANIEGSTNTQQTGSSKVFMSAEATTTDAPGTAKRVLVTGASGRTGGIVFEKLLAKEGYATRGMVRSEQVGDESRPGLGCMSTFTRTSELAAYRLFSRPDSMYFGIILAFAYM